MDVIDIKIRDQRYVARFQENPFALEPYDLCLVERDGDKEVAKVKSKPYVWDEDAPLESEIYILRVIEENDFAILRSNHELEQAAFEVALDKIRERDLPMSLACVERAFDGRKMRFFFTADHRIDFRELVKDLAHVYRTRIEMRQIGVRDRSKKIGGYGICGQELCCARFLQKFEPITIRMAKDQNLALNPTKISGLCGRLMCCLAYEVDGYVEARREFPRNGVRVDTPYGKGTLSGMNYVKSTVNVMIDEGSLMEFSMDELKILKG